MTNELKLMYNRPENITTFYYDQVSEDTARKRLRSINTLDYNRYVLIVEKIGFQKTEALLEGDAQLLFSWQNVLNSYRFSSQRDSYFSYWAHNENTDDHKPLQ